MGDITEVYGCIIGPSFYDQDIWMGQQNVARIAQLPEADARPALTRDMFLIPHHSSPSSLYIAQVIVFGATYNRVEYVWDRWLAKFEALLHSVYCEAADVHLLTSLNRSYHYRWEPASSENSPLAGDTPVPIQDWRFSGGPRSFGQ
jgi:hypothetical protein